MSLSSSVLLVCLVLLSLSVSPASGSLTFQAFNDSSCTQPLSQRRYPSIDLPNADCAFGFPGHDQCIIAPSPNITAIVYRITAELINVRVYTLPTLLNASYCPSPYVATPRTLQIFSYNGLGPVQVGGSCWQLAYSSVDHKTGSSGVSPIYGTVTCSSAPSSVLNAAADSHSAHTLPTLAAAAAVSALLLL